MKNNISFRRQTLPQQLADFLRLKLISGMQPGQGLPSIHQLAEQYEVSPMTLRSALSILAQRGVIEIRHGSGTYVSDPTHGRHLAILLNIDPTESGVSDYWLGLAQQLRLRLNELGMSSRLYLGVPSEADERLLRHCPEFLEDLQLDRFTGVASIHGGSKSEWYDAVLKKGIPVVGTRPSFASCVLIDYEQFVVDAVDRLVESGRTNLAFLEWDSHPTGSTEALRPIFERRMRHHQLRVRENWCRRDIRPTIDGAGWSQFREIWTSDSIKPEGIIVSDDLLLDGVLRAVADMKLGPDSGFTISSHSNAGVVYESDLELDLCDVNAGDIAESIAQILQNSIHRGVPAIERKLLSMKWRSDRSIALTQRVAAVV